MKLIIHFSAREDGNCGSIARYIASPEDRVIRYGELRATGCDSCGYECFDGRCKYRDDGVYGLYQSMTQYERVILVVPMYGGNPCSSYFAFCERGQDYFRSEEAYDAVIRRLYIIGVYGSQEETPGFIPCLNSWFAGTDYHGRVLGLERHQFGQKMADNLLELPQVCRRIKEFSQ